MDTSRLTGLNVNDIISGVAADNAGAGAIGGYCEPGFPFFYANQAMVDMLGYDDLDDLVTGIGGLVGNTIHPDDLPQVTADLGNNYHEGQVYETTYRMPRKDGTWFWTVDRGEVIRAKDGRLAIISVCQDMTEFMRRQQEIKRKSLLNESIISGLPSGYHRCAAEPGYPFLYVSERFKQMLGWTEEELRLRFDYKFLNLVHPEDRKLTIDYVKHINAGEEGTYQDSVYRLACKSGYRWFVDATLECTINDKAFYQGFITDITSYIEEREEREAKMREAMLEAERANASKTSFLRHMSHDIRTPLNGILGMLEIERRFDDDPAKRAECRRKTLEATNYLLNLVDNILDMNKLESGKIELEEKPFDLVEVLSEMTVITEAQALEAGIAFSGGKEMSRIVHRRLIGSPVHLNRVLMNLANNAIKYNQPGGSVCTYCSEFSSTGDVAVYQFVCDDTGIGMSEEFQEHAFDVFSQENPNGGASLTGTGLGLSIVKELVELMGGSIELESAPGMGTTFTVTIPFKIDPAAAGETDLAAAPLDLTGKRALLVEDNELNLEIAQMMLGDLGLIVDCARNGAEAVKAFSESALGTYDFIFMDVMMPVMDGLTAARHIRALERQDAIDVVILAMTANAFQDDIRASLEAGMCGHITKPLVRRQIEEVIAQALAQR